MSIPIIGQEVPKEFQTYCPVCQINTPFAVNPRQDGTCACMGCAIVYVIEILLIIAKARRHLGITDEPLDSVPDLIPPKE